jgi:hypothetical protein
MNTRGEPLKDTDVAIVGWHVRFPGANTIDEFWQNLRNGVESITVFTPEELTAAGYDDATVRSERFVPALLGFNLGVEVGQLRRARLLHQGVRSDPGRSGCRPEPRMNETATRDLLVELADRDRLGSLEKTARPLGEFFNVHVSVPVRRRPVSSHPS